MISNVYDFDCFEWADFIASSSEEPLLKLWLSDKESFFNRYFFLDIEPNTLVIADKKTLRTYSFEKSVDNFFLPPLPKHKEIVEGKPQTLFKIGKIEILKNN